MSDEPLQKARHNFPNPDNPLSQKELLKYVGEELTSVGLYQQDTRARFLDSTLCYTTMRAAMQRSWRKTSWDVV